MKCFNTDEDNANEILIKTTFLSHLWGQVWKHSDWFISAATINKTPQYFTQDFAWRNRKTKLCQIRKKYPLKSPSQRCKISGTYYYASRLCNMHTYRSCLLCCFTYTTVCSPIKANWQLSLQFRYLHFFWPRHSIEQAIVHFEVNFWNSKSKIVVTTKDLIF